MRLHKRPTIHLVIEYVISIYIIVANVINIWNKFAELPSELWIMEDNFWGPGLVVFLVIVYLLSSRNEGTKIIAFRPYIMALAIAGIMSVRSLPLSLVLLFALGCMLVDGRDRLTVDKICNMALITAAEIECYSIIDIASTAKQGTPVQGTLFLYSIFPDVLLVIALVVKLCTKNRKIAQFLKKHLKKETIFRCLGVVVCFFAVSLFLFYTTAINIGRKKVQESTEEVYLLEHYQDTSRVLSAVKNTADNGYTLQFADYTGANNQKIRLVKISDELYQLVFVDPELAITLKIVDDQHGELSLETPEDKLTQKWVVDETDEERSIYRIRQANDYPLCYALMPEGEREDLVFAMRESGCWEFFIVQHTLADEFLTETPIRYYDDFYPTLLMETIFALLGKGAVLVWFAIVGGLMAAVSLRKIWGEAIALVFAVLFLWLVAYGALSVIAILWVFIVIESWIRRGSRDEKNKNIQLQ